MPDQVKQAAQDAKTEQRKVADEAKQDARDEKFQRTQEQMLERMLSIAASGNRSELHATGYANPGPRTRSVARNLPPSYAGNDSDEHESENRKSRHRKQEKQIEPLEKWTRTKVKEALKAVELESLHEKIGTKGLSSGLGLSQITSEADLLTELGDYIKSGEICNIDVKSLYTLIVQWKKVDSLYANACACTH